MSMDSVIPVTFSNGTIEFLPEKNSAEKIRSGKARTSHSVNPSCHLNEILTKKFFEAIEESQKNLYETFRQIQEHNAKVIAGIALQQNAAIEQLISLQSQKALQSQPSQPSSPVCSKDSNSEIEDKLETWQTYSNVDLAILKQLNIIKQYQQGILEQLTKNSKPENHLPNAWQLKGLYRYRKAMETQSLLEKQMYNLSTSLEALDNESKKIKQALLAQREQLERDTLKVELTSLNFKEEIRNWREKGVFKKIADKLTKISKSFSDKIDKTYQKNVHFTSGFKIANSGMNEAYKEVREHLSYLEENEGDPELSDVLKKELIKKWNTLASGRFKLALDKHLMEAYTVAPKLRSLVNLLLTHINKSYSQRKEWEKTLPKESLSLLCTSVIRVDDNNSKAFSQFREDSVNDFNADNKLLADIYNDCKTYWAEPIKVEINYSQPSFKETPLPPTIYGREDLYFLVSLKVKEIKEKVKEAAAEEEKINKEIRKKIMEAAEEKSNTWKILYEEIRLLKKLILELAAQVNYISDIDDKKIFSDIAYYDIRRPYRNPALCKFRPADPLNVYEIYEIFNEFSEETEKLRLDKLHTDNSDSESEYSTPKSGYLLSPIDTSRKENTGEEKSSTEAEEIH